MGPSLGPLIIPGRLQRTYKASFPEYAVIDRLLSYLSQSNEFQRVCTCKKLADSAFPPVENYDIRY